MTIVIGVIYANLWILLMIPMYGAIYVTMVAIKATYQLPSQIGIPHTSGTN